MNDTPQASERRTKLLFVGTFFSILMLPMLQQAIGIFPEQPVNENRRLAAPPRVADGFAKFTEQAQKWYEDHFGFRSFLIRLKTQIDFSIFGSSDRVHVGKDGWLFYRAVIDRRRFKSHAFDLDSAERVARNVGRLNAALRQNGIALILTWNLLADRFVPKALLPNSFPKLPDSPDVQPLLSALANELGPAYLDMPALMKEVMKSRPAFHKTDFHWNDPAAFVAAQAIVQRAAALTGLPAPNYAFHLEVVERNWPDGGIAREMPLLFPHHERELFLKHEFVDSPGFARTFDDPLWSQTYRSTGDATGLLPPIAYIGDSFAGGIQVSGLHAHFRATYMTRWGVRPKLSDFIEALPADTGVLLLQSTEMGIGAVLRSDEADIDRAIAIIRARRR